jgi:hypothetical protein
MFLKDKTVFGNGTQAPPSGPIPPHRPGPDPDPLVHFDARGLEAGYAVEVLPDGARRLRLKFGRDERLTPEIPAEQAIALGRALIGE